MKTSPNKTLLWFGQRVYSMLSVRNNKLVSALTYAAHGTRRMCSKYPGKTVAVETAPVLYRTNASHKKKRQEHGGNSLTTPSSIGS